MTRALIRETLMPEQRLALAYAPGQSRDALLAILGLDLRLAQVVTGAREPILAQIRLAWWRDRLTEGAPPVAGEPLLALLDEAGADRTALRALVDAWEGLLDDGAVDAVARLAAARALALCSALPGAYTDTPVRDSIREWALHDLSRLPGEAGEIAARLAAAEAWRPARLPRALRPLAVLHALARCSRRTGDDRPGPASIAVALRVGLFGR